MANDSGKHGTSGGFTVRWGNITLSVVGIYVVAIVGMLAIAGAFLWIFKSYLDAVHVEHVALLRSLDRIEGEAKETHDLAAACAARLREGFNAAP